MLTLKLSLAPALDLSFFSTIFLYAISPRNNFIINSFIYFYLRENYFFADIYFFEMVTSFVLKSTKDCMKQKNINYQSIYCLAKILEVPIETQYLLCLPVYTQNRTVKYYLVLSSGLSCSCLQNILYSSPSK